MTSFQPGDICKAPYFQRSPIGSFWRLGAEHVSLVGTQLSPVTPVFPPSSPDSGRGW